MTNKRSIADFLQNWFTKNSNNKHLWSQDVIGLILKQRLVKRGNWKKAPSNKGLNPNSLKNLIRNKPNS